MGLTPGITASSDGIDGVAWNVVGHTYSLSTYS